MSAAPLGRSRPNQWDLTQALYRPSLRRLAECDVVHVFAARRIVIAFVLGRFAVGGISPAASGAALALAHASES